MSKLANTCNSYLNVTRLSRRSWGTSQLNSCRPLEPKWISEVSERLLFLIGLDSYLSVCVRVSEGDGVCKVELGLHLIDKETKQKLWCKYRQLFSTSVSTYRSYLDYKCKWQSQTKTAIKQLFNSIFWHVEASVLFEKSSGLEKMENHHKCTHLSYYWNYHNLDHRDL